MRTIRHREELRGHIWRRQTAPQVLLRDRYICHICGKPINPGYKSPHPLSASVDHLLGPATGHDQRYLRAAHRICNMKRGDPTKTGDPKPKGQTSW